MKKAVVCAARGSAGEHLAGRIRREGLSMPGVALRFDEHSEFETAGCIRRV